MLHAIAKAVKEHNADVGFGFDGDGDRVGVIDNLGEEIFSDKIGLLIARNLAPNIKALHLLLMLNQQDCSCMIRF
jgi:Phosphomannomutase